MCSIDNLRRRTGATAALFAAVLCQDTAAHAAAVAPASGDSLQAVGADLARALGGAAAARSFSWDHL